MCCLYRADLLRHSNVHLLGYLEIATCIIVTWLHINSGMATQEESSTTSPAAEPSTSAVNCEWIKKGRKYKVKALEKKLELLDRQIRRFNEADVSLDDMNEASSAYIKEHLLKRKFIDTWEKLCKLKGIDPEVGIEDEQTQNYSGTPYPEINRRVQRLLRMDEFPDCFDIVQLIERANTKHCLGISAEERSHLSTKVFKEVGKALKKRRHRDFVAHFGSHLTDQFKESCDPALQDTTLSEQLQKQLKEGEDKLARVCEEFASKQDKDGDKTDEGSSEDSEGEDIMELGADRAVLDILPDEKVPSAQSPDHRGETAHVSDGHDQGTGLHLPAELPEDIIIISD